MRREIWTIAILVWNVITFFLYGWDKLAAKNHWGRIKESLLLFVALLLGSCGALFGMVIWNHKTSKMKFRLLVPLFVIVNLIVFAVIPF